MKMIFSPECLLSLALYKAKVCTANAISCSKNRNPGLIRICLRICLNINVKVVLFPLASYEDLKGRPDKYKIALIFEWNYYLLWLHGKIPKQMYFL